MRELSRTFGWLGVQLAITALVGAAAASAVLQRLARIDEPTVAVDAAARELWRLGPGWLLREPCKQLGNQIAAHALHKPPRLWEVLTLSQFVELALAHTEDKRRTGDLNRMSMSAETRAHGGLERNPRNALGLATAVTLTGAVFGVVGDGFHATLRAASDSRMRIFRGRLARLSGFRPP
jgi:hypothetical protein